MQLKIKAVWEKKVNTFISSILHIPEMCVIMCVCVCMLSVKEKTHQGI